MDINSPDRNADFIGGIDYSEFGQVGRFVTATVSTNQLSGNSSKEFRISEDDEFVDTVTINPEDGILPKRARIISAKIYIDGGSTDTSFKVFQSDSFDPINQVINVQNISAGDTPETYSLSGGMGTPYVNKEGENDIHIKLTESSGINSSYDLELNWIAIHV